MLDRIIANPLQPTGHTDDTDSIAPSQINAEAQRRRGAEPSQRRKVAGRLRRLTQITIAVESGRCEACKRTRKSLKHKGHEDPRSSHKGHILVIAGSHGRVRLPARLGPGSILRCFVKSFVVLGVLCVSRHRLSGTRAVQGVEVFCSADVPSAMVVSRSGLVPSPTRRRHYKGALTDQE